MTILRLPLLALAFVLSLNNALAHGKWEYHYNDVARVLNGFGTPEATDAKKYHKIVLSNGFSPNAAPSTIESQKAFAGFFELFNQVSSGMDSMPRELEVKYGLKRMTFSHPNTHRFLCHGWALDDDPPKRVLEFFEKKSGVKQVELLNYWREYQHKTFAIAECYTRLPVNKAKAFASLIWDIHLLGDWTPDNSEISWLVPMKDISDDMSRNLKTLLGEGSEELCAELREFVNTRVARGMANRYIASEMVEWLSEKKIGDRIYYANKTAMKGLWSHDIAININDSIATIRTKKKLAEIGAVKEARRVAKEAKRRSTKPRLKTSGSPKEIVDEFKTQCKDAKIKRGVLQKSVTKEGCIIREGYLVRMTYNNSGRNAFMLFLKSPAFKGLKAGAAEGACAFIVSSGILLAMHHNGILDDDEFRHEMEKATLSSAVVGVAVGVTVALGASPTGWIVLAVGVGGYVVCDIVFELMFTKPFSVEDIIGYMDDEFESTVSFMTIGTKPIDTFVDAKRGDGFVDVPEVPTFVEPVPSKTKSFVDFLKVGE